jgi:DNA polymerase-3 subunit delta
MSMPFLAEKRFLAIFSPIEDKKEDFINFLQEKLEEDALPSDLVLVVIETGKKLTKKWQKEAHKQYQSLPYAMGFEELSGETLRAWYTTYITDRGGVLERSAAKLLESTVSNDLYQAKGILAQAFAYADGSPITMDILSLFLPETHSDQIFALVDAITQGKKKVAYELLQKQYHAGSDPYHIHAMLVRQYRLLLQIDSLIQSGITQQGQIAKQLGIHPYVAKKTIDLQKKLQTEEIQKAYYQLLQIDRQVKRGQFHIAPAIDYFIAKTNPA